MNRYINIYINIYVYIIYAYIYIYIHIYKYIYITRLVYGCSFWWCTHRFLMHDFTSAAAMLTCIEF